MARRIRDSILRIASLLAHDGYRLRVAPGVVRVLDQDGVCLTERRDPEPLLRWLHALADVRHQEAMAATVALASGSWVGEGAVGEA